MAGAPPRLRVAAYVVRDGAAGPELLVFDHVDFPQAGTQVPAGGMKPGEASADAAAREVAEETGLTAMTPVAVLGVRDRPHPVTGSPRRTTYVHLAARAGPARRWIHRVGGGGGDDGLLFACRFTPLPLTAPLADHQDELLGTIDPAWSPPARR